MKTRPSLIFLISISILIITFVISAIFTKKTIANDKYLLLCKKLVSVLTITDLCITTEARYTRNPAITDQIAPFMDHPGAIEHFPSGSFLAPPAH